MEYRIRRFDGVYRWHSFRALPVRDGGGGLRMWIGTATDVEDQKQLELSLRARSRSGRRTRAWHGCALSRLRPVGFKLVDRDLRIVRIDETLARIDGLSVAEHIGRTVADVAPAVWPRRETIYRGPLVASRCGTWTSARGARPQPLRTRHWLASFYPVWVRGEIIGVGNVVLDITERKEAEELRGVVMDNLAEGVFALDAGGQVVYLNHAAAQTLGWSEQGAARQAHARGDPLPARQRDARTGK